VKRAAFGLLLAANAQAAPFIVSDKYADDAVQPTHFQVKIGAAEAVDSLPVDGALKFDVGDLTGTQTATIVACNEFGCSSPVNFTFTAGRPSAPAAVRLSRQ
jgi:hypothetical protein